MNFVLLQLLLVRRKNGSLLDVGRIGRKLMKTLVEFFDSCQLVNVIAGISCKPETIIFIGDPDVMTSARREAVQRFFRMRKQKVKLEYVAVKLHSYDDILKKITGIIERYPDICFDITGGRELALAAMGEAACCHNIPMIQFDVISGQMIRVKNAEKIPMPEAASVTVRESVILNGGEIIAPGLTISADRLNSSFCKEIRALFSISKQNPKLWNQFVVALEGVANSAGLGRDLQVSKNISKLPENQVKKLLQGGFLKQLSDAGLLLHYQYENGLLQFRYKNERVHQCLSKSGSILEMYAYMLLHEISQEQPNLFSDKRMGVLADWDGVLTPRSHSGTKNEIDLIVTKNAVPIFISCKYGEVLKEALYELHTVAEHFGGTYAKKVLLTAELSRMQSKKNSFLQRARDMQIEVIYNVHRMSEDELKARLCAIGHRQ